MCVIIDANIIVVFKRYSGYNLNSPKNRYYIQYVLWLLTHSHKTPQNNPSPLKKYCTGYSHALLQFENL